MTIGAYSISQFKSRLSGGGARPNLFEVRMALPPGLNWGGGEIATSANTENKNNNDKAGGANETATTFSFLCKAAALPASNIGSIDVPFRGRIFKVAGDRTVDPWTVTIINDENFQLRRTFEEWVKKIATSDTNIGVTNPAGYMSNANVYQLGRSSGTTATPSAGGGAGDGKKTTETTNATSLNHTILANYKFVDIFPTSVSQIDLSYDSSDAIEEFTVEFQVQHWAYLGNTLETTSSSTDDKKGAK
jgi:hypothetical protein